MTLASLENVKHYRITFKHWKTGKPKVIEARDIEGVHVNPQSDRVIVWNITDGTLEDIIRDTIVEQVEIEPTA